MKEIRRLKGRVVRNLTEPMTATEGETAEASFSSDMPITGHACYHDGHYLPIEEKLVHDEGAVRFHTDPLPVLLSHRDWDAKEQVGVVEVSSISIEGGKLRGTLMFSGHSELGQIVGREVKDGFRRNLSIGYSVGAYEDEIISGEDGEPTKVERTVNEWTIHEISVVSVPADASVGVGRSLATGPAREATPMSEVAAQTQAQTQNEAADMAAAEQQAAEARAAAEAALRERRAAITALVEENLSDAPETALAVLRDAGDNVDQAKDLILQHQRERQAAPLETQQVQRGPEPVDTEGDERFRLEWRANIGKLMLNVFNRSKERADLDGAELEYQQSLAAEGRDFQSERSVKVPFLAIARQKLYRHRVGRDKAKAEHADRLLRAFDGQGAESGANLITTMVRQDMVRLVLEEGDIVMRLGAQMLNINTPTTIPVFTDGVTAEYIDGTSTSSSPTESTPNVEARQIQFRTISARVPVARSILDGGAPMAITFLIDQGVTRTAAVMSRAAIHGSGTGANPQGVITHIGTTQRTDMTTAGQPTHAEIRELVADVSTRMKEGNMLMVGSTSLLTTPNVTGHILSTVREGGDARMIGTEMMNGMVMVDGQSVYSWTGLDANTIVYGDWSNIIVGVYGSGFETQIDPYVDHGGQILRIWADLSPIVVRNEAFGYLATA